MRDAPTAKDVQVFQMVSETGAIAGLNSWLDRAFAKSGEAASVCDDLKLCVNEAVANVVAHGGRKNIAIEVRLWKEPESIFAEVSDDGPYFDPTQSISRQTAIDLESEEIGGWGLQLMRQSSDEFLYRRKEGRNYNTFRKFMGA